MTKCNACRHSIAILGGGYSFPIEPYGAGFCANGDEEEDFDVMVVDDNEGEPFLEVHLIADDEYVEFGGGEWYFS